MTKSRVLPAECAWFVVDGDTAWDIARHFGRFLGANEHTISGAPSNSYLRRLFAQGQIKIDGGQVRNPNERIAYIGQQVRIRNIRLA